MLLNPACACLLTRCFCAWSESSCRRLLQPCWRSGTVVLWFINWYLTCRCTHGSRDCRCGTIGDKLVRRLDSLIAERDLEASIAVFRCSHIGGHKVRASLYT